MIVLQKLKLFVSKDEIVYAVSNDDIHPIIFTANTLKGKNILSTKFLGF